jgi:hypothetical protein
VDYDPSEAETIFAGIFASPVSSELSYRLDQALEVTDALWELVPIVVAAGEQHDRQPPDEAADQSPAARRLTDDQRNHARNVADAILAMQETEEELDASVLDGLTLHQAIADPFGILARLTNVPEQTARVLSMLERAVALSPDELFYLRVYVRAKQKSERTPMLLRALFATVIGSLEPLVTRLVLLLRYHANPTKYESLAAEQLEDDVRELCFGPPDKWRRSLAQKLGVTTLNTAVDWDRLTSLWEDRNVITHRGGLTDLRHSAKTKTEPGSVLSPDADAVRTAADVIGATRFALVACVWDHLDPGKGSLAAQMAGGAAWESLRAGRWEQAELLGRLEQLLGAEPHDKATAQVHRWLATDMGRGPEAIRAAVEAWDVAPLPPIYQAARQVLLRQDEQAIALLRGLIDTGDITQEDLDSWPLFDRLRGQARFGGLRDRHESVL